MVPHLHIRRISLEEVDLQPLRSEAVREGIGFVDRLLREWKHGSNRFDAEGEALLGAYCGEQLIAVAGLNREPYEPAPRRARLRHLYVLRAFRRRGVASRLVRDLIDHARAAFDEVRLRTDSADAAAFYDDLGFQRVQCAKATHLINL